MVILVFFEGDLPQVPKQKFRDQSRIRGERIVGDYWDVSRIAAVFSRSDLRSLTFARNGNTEDLLTFVNFCGAACEIAGALDHKYRTVVILKSAKRRKKAAHLAGPFMGGATPAPQAATPTSTVQPFAEDLPRSPH